MAEARKAGKIYKSWGHGGNSRGRHRRPPPSPPTPLHEPQESQSFPRIPQD